MKVYFIQAGSNGPIKIGCSRDPENRCKDLSECSPYCLKIVAEIDGTHKEEKNIHNQFRQCRMKGEWFYPMGELIEFIKTLPNNRVLDIWDPVYMAELRKEAINEWVKEKKARGGKYEGLLHRQ
jgi:hypothetical protein